MGCTTKQGCWYCVRHFKLCPTLLAGGTLTGYFANTYLSLQESIEMSPTHPNCCWQMAAWLGVIAVAWPNRAADARQPCLDAHVHLTNTSTLQYTWQQSLPQLNRTWTIADLESAAASSPLQPMEVVFIEVSAIPDDWISEMHYIQSLADAQPPGEPIIKGIVGHVALQNGPSVGPLLDQLQKQVPLFRGVRQGESSGFLNNDTFMQGVCELGARNLEFDVLGGPSLFPRIAELARRCQRTRLVLDHMGSPAIYEGAPAYDDWAPALTELSKEPNVYVKISGAPSEASHGTVGNWTVEEVEPFVRHAIEAFGWERSIFAGNWFFLRLGGTYETWGRAVATILDRMKATDEQREMVFVSNARKAYNL